MASKAKLLKEAVWIDTSDLENYPKIYRFDTGLTDGSDFVLLDNTDQTTEEGIVFVQRKSWLSFQKKNEG